MKKLSLLAIAMSMVIGVFTVFATSSSLVKAEDAGGNGIKISPVRTDLTINAGDSQTITMNVQNVTSSEATFSAIVNDFVSGGESGQPALILDANKYAPSHSLKRYISVIPDVTLKAGEAKDIKVTITIPKDAAAGGYYGAVRLTPASTSSGNKNVSLSASVGSIILVKVPGDIKEDLTIISFDVRKGENGVGGSSFFTSNKDLYVAVRFQNQGNVHEQPFGKVRLLKNGKVLESVEINGEVPKSNVLPDSIRRFNVKLDKVSSFGKYTVDGNFGYGDNGKLLSAQTSFWVVPVVLIIAVIAVLIVVVAAFFIIPRMIKNYNKRVLRKAGRR